MADSSADPPPDTSTTPTANLAALQAELESLRSDSTRQSIEAEEALHDLAAKLASVEQLLEQEKVQNQSITQREEQERNRAQGLEEQLRLERERQKGAGDEEQQRRNKEQELIKEKRDLLEALDREQADKKQLEESLTSLRSLHTQLQSSHSTLEASLAEQTSTARTSLLRIQTLTSTISSLEADKQFLTTELERGRTEWSTYRREKHEELIRVQSQLENAEIESRNSKSSLDSLKTAHEQLKSRHDETLAQLAKTREERDANEGNFAAEMGSMKRLVEMMEKREEERKRRVEEVERGLEEERAQAAEREEQLKEELQAERERCDNLEVRYGEMREALERGTARFAPGDDAQGSPSPVGSSFALSPSAQLAVRGQKNGRSYAEIYGEYVRMEEELVRERAESKRLSDCLAQILGDIEERAPLLKEQRVEYERLSVEATSLASQLAQAISDRDNSSRQSEAHRLDIDRLERDNTILGHQLRDLGRQVRTLSRSIAAAQGAVTTTTDSPDDFDEEEAAILARAEADSTTDAVVSAHLVTFASINELQLQNQKLLRITREMGAQMERGEEEYAARRRDVENRAVEEAHELILKLKEEVEGQRERMGAFERERDMFRRMLAQRGEGGGMAAITSGGASNGTSDSMDVDTPRLLADVQSNFDAYKNEIAIDSQRLREDLKDAQHAANAARTELAKSKAQAEYTAERFRLLTENFELQSNEMAQMSKRALQLQQSASKQEMSVHKMSEDLMDLRGQSDQLRHENTNLRSEREVGKSVEKRLIEENTALSKERAHLADLMRNLQTMQNELERSGSESRRRLEEQVTRLEGQSTELKEKLNQETDASRQLALRKELDAKAYQDRLDKLTAEHSTTREALIGATTSKEHLEQRVADLVIQITAKEEKLAIYEGRGNRGAEDPSRTVEEQLEVTVADLRAELRSVKAELERANVNVQQFKDIAEAEGAALTELTTTYDAYKASTDAALAEKESEITSLRERLHSLTTDITTTNTQNSDLHRQIEAERVAFEKERKALEDSMASLRSADQTARESQLAAQDDLRRQAQLAKEAHEKYERELVAHAEDVKRLSEVKNELETVRASVGEHQTAAEVAKANLVSTEQSLGRQKSALEQELTDVRKRCDDLTSQNALLHEHLETFSSQAAHLQARQAVGEAPGEGATTADQDSIDAITASHNSSVEQLRGVIRHLRSDKEVVDYQLQLAKTEATRLKTQLDYATRGLEEARQSLTEERQKSGDTTASSAQHAELLERINTAKLLRESNQTLRDENETTQRKLAQVEGRLRQALAELDPLKEQVQTLQAEVEAKEHNIKLLEEDNERWKNRNQTILAKYERIDPEELQVLKNEVEALKTERDALVAEKDALQVKVEEQTKLADSMRENWTNGQNRFKALQTQARATRDEKVVLTNELAELRAQMESGSASNVNTEAQQAQIAALEAEKTALESRIKEQEAAIDVRLKEATAALEARIKEQEDQRTQLLETAKQTEERLTAERDDREKARLILAGREKPIFEDNKRMRADLKVLRPQLDQLNVQIAELTQLKEKFEADNVEAIEKVVQARVAAIETAPTPSDTAIEETVKAKVAAAEATFTAEREAAVATAVATATATLEADLAKVRAELATASSTPADAPAANTEELDKAKAEFEMSKQALVAEFEKVKTQLGEEAKVREKEITDRLTAEIKKANDAAAQAVSSSGSSAPAPAVDVDALVHAKLDALEGQRAAAQQKAIEEAIAKTVKEQEALAAQKLVDAKASLENEAKMRTSLLTNKVKALETKLKAATGGAAPAALPSKPAANSASPPATGAPANGRTGRAAARAGAANRGAGGGGAAGRAGGNAGSTPAAAAPVAAGGLAARVGQTAPTAPATTTPATAAPPSLSLRGAAGASPAARQPGGVLGGLLSSALGGSAPKRAREEEGGAAGDAAKRPKGGPPPKGGAGGSA